MNISSCISYDGKYVDLDFPIGDDLLDETLQKNGLPTDTTLPFLVEDVHYPLQLDHLSGEYINLDEINFLAKRIECFFEDEWQQFVVAAEKTNAKSLKDLINLTFNLDKFTIIKDVSSMAQVGRDYVLNTEGAVPVNPKLDEKYAEIGRNLLSSGRGIFTEYGLLFIEDKPIEEIYDGQVFPVFCSEPSIVGLELEYFGKYETVFLPDSELAVQKAVRRLGAQSIGDCNCICEIESPKFHSFAETFREIFENEGITALNGLLREIKDREIDSEKLASAIECTDAASSGDILTLIGYLDEIELISEISRGDYESVGRFFVENSDQYSLSPDLYDYFDFDEFGKYIEDEFCGHFTENGFMYCDGCRSLEDIQSEFEDESSSMMLGGI